MVSYLIMELKNVIKDIKLLTELKDNEDYEIND